MTRRGGSRARDIWRAVQEWALVAFVVALPIGKSPAEIALGVGLVALVGRTLLGHRRPASGGSGVDGPGARP
mgnify:CR=1 FL=1